MSFYKCNEDGLNSALYVRRRRQVSWWGWCGPVSFPIKWDVIEFRRVTCAPGQLYTMTQSDWFTRTFSNEYNKYLDSYSRLGFIEGWNQWWLHQKALKTGRSHAFL